MEKLEKTLLLGALVALMVYAYFHQAHPVAGMAALIVGSVFILLYVLLYYLN